LLHYLVNQPIQTNPSHHCINNVRVDMDPLSALSLACNIIQFIDFTGKLINDGVEIYTSKLGSTDANLELESLYGQLSDLSSRLLDIGENGPEYIASEQEGSSRHMEPCDKGLVALAKGCRKDCDKIIEVVRKLRIDGKSHRRWRSFRAALEYAWGGEGKIRTLQQTLHDKQNALTLYMCSNIRLLFHTPCRWTNN
jgi:hypothetical protein